MSLGIDMAVGRIFDYGVEREENIFEADSKLEMGTARS